MSDETASYLAGSECCAVGCGEGYHGVRRVELGGEAEGRMGGLDNYFKVGLGGR